VPTPIVPEALVPWVPSGAGVTSPFDVELWLVPLLTPALADRAAVPTPIVPEALVPCVPSGALVPEAVALPVVLGTAVLSEFTFAGALSCVVLGTVPFKAVLLGTVLFNAVLLGTVPFSAV